jgi:hypothetical protein
LFVQIQIGWIEGDICRTSWLRFGSSIRWWVCSIGRI